MRDVFIRYDPDIRVSDVIDTENERVDFIMTITQVCQYQL